MARRNEPVRKSVKEILEDLLAGHREAAFSGPESAQKYLRRTFDGQASLPNAVKAVAYDLNAEALARCGQWDACAESVISALGYLPDLDALTLSDCRTFYRTWYSPGPDQAWSIRAVSPDA